MSRSTSLGLSFLLCDKGLMTVSPTVGLGLPGWTHVNCLASSLDLPMFLCCSCCHSCCPSQHPALSRLINLWWLYPVGRGLWEVRGGGSVPSHSGKALCGGSEAGGSVPHRAHGAPTLVWGMWFQFARKGVKRSFWVGRLFWRPPCGMAGRGGKQGRQAGDRGWAGDHRAHGAVTAGE